MVASGIVLTRHRRLVVLAAVCLAALVLPLSFSAGAVATPAIGREFGADPARLNWITNAFMLTFGSFVMAAGALADQYGRKRVFGIGIVSFAVISVALAGARSVLALDLLRAAQGLAAAAALSGGTAALAQEFDGHARAKAFSLLGTTFGVGLAFGPLVAGMLIETWGWRSVFLSGAVVGAVAVTFGIPRMRETRDPAATGLDWPGTLTFSSALTLLTLGLMQVPQTGWSSAPVVAMLAGSALLWAAFTGIEQRVARPMLDLSLFRYRRFVGVQLLPVATCCCYVVLLVILPLRFIGIDGHGESEAGWLMLALSAPMLVVPFLAAILGRRFGPGVVSVSGLLIAASGLAWLSRLASAGGGHAVMAPMLLIGLGAAMPWGLMDGLALSVVPPERAGMATGIFSTTRVASEGIALALVNAVLTGLTNVHLSKALVAASHAAPRVVSEAARQLGIGDLARASALLPSMNRALLLGSYEAAFADLLQGLAAVTFVSALTVGWFLGRKP